MLSVFSCAASRNKRECGGIGVEAANRTSCGCAPGFRPRETGDLVNVGNYGFSYSSSVSGSNGVYLSFHVTHLNPSHADSRAYGFQLRCLSE